MERKLPLILFLGGIASIIASVVTGKGKAGIFIIFPFVVGTGWLMLLGVVFVFVSVVAFMFTISPDERNQAAYSQQTKSRTEKKAGGLILIGPIPIVISSDKKLALALLIIGVAAAVILWLPLPRLA